MSERWADVLGYGGLYQVSDQGRVRQGSGVYSRVLSQTKTNVGYLVVSLSDGTGFKRKYVHRLVADAFMPDHAKGAEVNHINGDKTDNRLVNLEWVTHKENLQRLALLGLMALPDLIRRNSMTVIPDMAAEVEEVRRDNDVVRRWMYDQMVDDRSLDDRWTEDVYAEFKVWCDRNGEKYGTTQATFTKRVLATLATLEVYVSRNRETHRQGRKFRLATHEPFSEVASVASVATQEPQVEP